MNSCKRKTLIFQQQKALIVDFDCRNSACRLIRNQKEYG